MKEIGIGHKKNKVFKQHSRYWGPFIDMNVVLFRG